MGIVAARAPHDRCGEASTGRRCQGRVGGHSVSGRVDVMAGGVARNGIRGAPVAVVEVVIQQEDEVARAALGCRAVGRLPEDGAAAALVAAQADVAGRGIDEQPGIAVGRVGIDQCPVLAVVHGVAAVAVGHTTVVECKHRRADEAQPQCYD